MTESKSNSKVILNLTSLEDRMTPSGDPYLPPPAPPPPVTDPVVVVVLPPIVLPPMMPNSVHIRVAIA